MPIAIKLLILAGAGIIVSTSIAFYAIGSIDRPPAAWTVSPVPEFVASVPSPIVPAPSPAPSPCARRAGCTRPHHGHGLTDRR